MNWKDEDWEQVIWSDECYVYIGDDRGTVYVTQSADEEYDESCFVPKFKQSLLRIMVWACIMKNSKGPMVVLEYLGGKGGGMNADRYQEQVLEHRLYDYYMERMEKMGQVVFQQDGALSHTARSMIAWFAQNSIKQFLHPPSSPDLSPIEPLWKTLKNYIRAQPHLPSSIAKLKTAVCEAWNQITKEDINVHVKHMNDQLQAVLAVQDGHTKY